MMPMAPFGRTPLISLRDLLGRRGGKERLAPLELTCYGKADCSLCEKAKVPVDRLVRSSGGRIVARWVDIHTDDALLDRWGQRIPVVCIGEQVLAEGKISELWLRRAIEAFRRESSE